MAKYLLNNTFIFYYFSIIFLIAFIETKGKLSEEFENIVTMKKLIKCYNWDYITFELQRIGNSPNDKSINNFYYNYATDSRDLNNKQIFLNKLMNIDSTPINDLPIFKSIYIKENLTDFYGYSISQLYTGDKFLFKNKYNFITLFNSTVYVNRGIKFYSLKKENEQYTFETLNTSLNNIFGSGGEIVPWHKLAYYTKTDTNTIYDLQNNGAILISAFRSSIDGYLVFFELEINTLNPKKIIYHLKDAKNSFLHTSLNDYSKQYTLQVFRNRFALFIYLPYQIKYHLTQPQLYLTFDLNALQRYYRPGAGPYDYYFIQEPKNLKINGIERAHFCQIYTVLELSNRNVIKSIKEQKIEEENLIKLNFDLVFFYCFQNYFLLNRDEDYFFCEIMKLNLKGNNSNNSNKNLTLDENNTISLIAPFKEENTSEIGNGYLLKNIIVGYPHSFRLSEINRLYDKENNVFLAKYIAIGINENPESHITGGNTLNYRIFKVYFDLKNNSNIKFDYLGKEQKSINFRKENGSKLFGLELTAFDIVNIFGTSKFLIGFYSFLYDSTKPIEPEEKEESLYFGYIESLFDSECEEKEYNLSEIDNNFNIIEQIFSKINIDINRNEFLPKNEIEENKSKLAIKFVGCQFKGENYTGQCTFQNILLEKYSDLILNTKYYYDNDQIIIKNPKTIAKEECLLNVGIYIYKYNIFKLILDEEDIIISSELMNACTISINYDFDCNNTSDESSDESDKNDSDKSDESDSDKSDESDKSDSNKSDDYSDESESKDSDGSDISNKTDDSQKSDDHEGDRKDSFSKYTGISLVKYIFIIGYLF